MTSAPQEHSVVAIYDTQSKAQAAVEALEKAGLDMKRLSVVAKDFHSEEHPIGIYTTENGPRFWGGRGAFWGGLWGMLVGSALFFVPAIGPIVVMGPLVGLIVGSLEGAAVQQAGGVLGAALGSIGIPSESVTRYEHEVKAGKFLVIARGTPEMIAHARTVLEDGSALHLTTHS